MTPFCRDGAPLDVTTHVAAQIDFNFCFQEGVGLTSLAAVCILAIANRFWFLRSRPNLPTGMTHPHRFLIGAKMILALGNLATALTVIALATGANEPQAASTYLAWSLLCVTLAIALPTHYLEYLRSRRPSTSLSTFYALLTLLLAVRLRTLVLLGVGDWWLAHSITQLSITAVLFFVENASSKGKDLRKSHQMVATDTSTSNETPENTATFLSKITFFWVTDLLLRGRKAAIEFSDLWDLPWALRSRRSGDLLQDAWTRECAKHPQNPSFTRALLAVFGPRLLFNTFLAFLEAGLSLVTPLFVQYFVNLVLARGTPDERPKAEGVTIAIMFFVIGLVSSLITGQQQHIAFMEVTRCRVAIQDVVYRKALTIPSHSRSSTGEIVNHSQVDADNVAMTLLHVLDLLPAPLILSVALFMLYQQVGWSMVMTIVLMLAAVPVLSICASRMMDLRTASLAQTDGRIKAITEALNGIKTLKLYGWTKYLRNRILGFRDQELALLRRVYNILSVQVGVSLILPSISTFAVFSVYAAVSPPNTLTAGRVFVALSLFRLIEHPVQGLVWGWSPLVEAYASVHRIGRFLQTKQLDQFVERTNDVADPIAISIDRSEFLFVDGKPVLTIDALAIPRGSLTAVVGKVGSGKTALLSAMLGEIYKAPNGGKVVVNGRVAYVSQSAWIMNGTVRDNILFGCDLDKDKYRAVLRACALDKDLQVLSHGDRTQIGEKGINLSGGQKARITCARALYADAEIILMDDPLSAVDAHVDRHMFNAWFHPQHGLLRGKTVVLVTHAVHHLVDVDHILAIKDGKIHEQGTYAELMAANGTVAEIVNEYMAKRESPSSSSSSSDADEAWSEMPLASAVPGGHRKSFEIDDRLEVEDVARKLLRKSQSRTSMGDIGRNFALADGDVTSAKLDQDEGDDDLKEANVSGKVTWSVYMTYFRHCGLPFVAAYVLMTFIGNALGFVVTLWLGAWGTASSAGNGGDVAYWLSGYAGIVFAGSAISVFTFYFFFVFVAIRASRTTMVELVDRIFRAPLSFFDVTPSGRVLNRMSRDQSNVDNEVPLAFDQCVFLSFQLLGTVITIMTATPWIILLVVPIAGIFYVVQQLYLSTSREVQRIYLVHGSPVYQHFTESLDGLGVIRAYGHAARFESDAEQKLDNASKSYYSVMSTSRWLFVQLQLLGNLIIGTIGLLAVLTPTTGTAVIGASLQYSLDITSVISDLLRTAARLENVLVSVERIKEYSEVPTEAAEETPFDLDQSWPAKGAIEFKDYTTSYRPGLDPVLKHVNLSIKAGERVGIVGRTGAGKSSLTLALFRAIEATGGSILVDGEDLSTIGLDDVRSRLTILPQDPILFDAKVRDNLDPSGTKDDAALWHALEGAGLAGYVRQQDDALDAMLTASSLSVGQAQLLCLARAILRKTKVLVLDEATASIDHQTDEIVQKTIRREFAGCTVLTIAHRIATILDYDKVCVLDQGEVTEFDKPEALLSKADSIFYSLAKESGLVQ
ncbi:Multidrug resistance-associated protein 1 [Allomyces arbusculus]|nr:Multidrug resistance-associated protein 1 [Allomyces arbusculus]